MMIPSPERGATRVAPEDRAQLEQAPVSMRRVAALFSPYRFQLAVVALLIAGAAGLTVVQPFIVRRIVDDAILGHDVPLLVFLVVSLVGLAILTQVVGVIQTWMSTKVGQSIMHTLRVDVFAHLQRQSIRFFTSTRAGEIQSRLTNDIAGMRAMVSTTATSIATNVTMSIAIVAAMIALSPTLSLLSLVVLPPAIWLTRQVALKRRDKTAAQQRTLAELQSTVNESLSVSGIRLSKTLGMGDRTKQSFSDLSGELVELEMQSQLAGRWRMALMQVLFAAIPALIYLVAGLPATGQGMSAGTLIAFTGLQTQVFRPLTGLLNVSAQWIASMALFSRIFAYLDLEPEIVEPASPRDTEIRGHEVIFHDVSFRYPEAEQDAVTGLTLTLEEGTTTAVIGHTGSGKSTVASLLLRLMDPSAGRITVGGVDLRDISERERARLIGVVSQEVYLAHDTIRNNLLSGKPDASDAELWQALEQAQIVPLIRELADGLDTVVGARGYRFSGGEQQRLAIARTLLSDPAILILDEATSALDQTTEHSVRTAIHGAMAGRTVMSITHRLHQVKNAHQVLELMRGRPTVTSREAFALSA